MSGIGKIFHAIGHVFVVVAHGFAALVGSDQAHAFAKAAVDILKTEAGQIVLTTVESLEGLTPPLPGSDKNAQAFSAIKNSFMQAGIEAKDSYIKLLIEAAVAVVKGTFSLVEKLPGTSVPAPAPAPQPPVSPVAPVSPVVETK